MSQFQALQTIRVAYQVMRPEADEDAAAIAIATEGNFAQKPAGAIQIKPSDAGLSAVNGMEVIFCGGAAADKTFSFKVWGWRSHNGPAELVCSGDGILGTQQVVKYPHNGATATSKFWADTLTITDVWLTTVDVSDSGNDRIAKIIFDTCGFEWFFIEITLADGTGTKAGDISAYYSYF
jgi:hypothetical protein